MVLDNLEFDKETGVCYILGFMRSDANGVFDYGFVGKLDVERGSVTDCYALDAKQYYYLQWYKAWEETGFTEKEFERNPLNKLENIESTSIKEIFDSAKA